MPRALGTAARELQSGRGAETIEAVEDCVQGSAVGSSGSPFHPGAMVVLTLGNPREKFWGSILTLATEGVSLRGVELASFDDLVALVKEGDAFSPGVIFFPMHRVERMELDLPDGSLPSLTQRFAAKTGLDPLSVLYGNGLQPRPPEEKR